MVWGSDVKLGSMADALAPFKPRLPVAVQEREILRVVAAIEGESRGDLMALAKREVLLWAQKRCGGHLPKVAWDGESFDYLAGGRTTLAVCIRTGRSELWALRGDDPDKEVPGRIWTTEVTLGRNDNETPQLSLRLLVNSPEPELLINPHVPGLLRQIADRCGLWAGGHPIKGVPWRVESDEEVDTLIALLESRARRLPVLVASGDERAHDPARPTLDVDLLAQATLGMAHVVILPAHLTYALSDAFGKVRSVYHGAVRAYLSGFDSASDPYEHRLIIGEAIYRDPQRSMNQLQAFVAHESLRRNRIGLDVLPFAAVRSAALRIEQEQRATGGASDAQQLETALRRVEALEAEVKDARSEAEQALELAEAEEARAKAAEVQFNAARVRLQALEEQLNARGVSPDATLSIPTTWDGFADWCDQAFVGRLALTPAARRGLRKPEFADVGLVGRCIKWLASTCRERRIKGGGSLANIPIGNGIENAPCGGDTFEFDYQGQRFSADWHVKSGGNTRDPIRCLRIYYTFDEATQQILIADMPAHRRTGAT